MKPKLTIERLCAEAKAFALVESTHAEPNLYGVTDGKAIGTYLEHKFQEYLRDRYDYRPGSSAKGIDFPEINVDLKVTRITNRNPPALFALPGKKCTVWVTISSSSSTTK